MADYNNKARKIDLSAKFLQMGQALQEEGDDVKDNGIIMLGTILMFMATLALQERDLFKFSELVAMFSAKKTLDNLSNNNSPIMDLLKDSANEKSYDEIIAELKKAKKRAENNEDEENIDE